MSPNPPSPERLAGLISRARAADGQPPFSDQSLVELGRGERTLVEGERDADIQGAAIVAAAIVGTDEFELVVDPDARRAGVGAALVQRVLTAHPEVTYAWAHGDHPASRALARRFGFEPVRTLLQLRRALEHKGKAISGLPRNASAEGRPGPRDPAPIDTKVTTFRPGIDDAGWLTLNARAFADHPEQGGLTQQDLDDRKAEEWFDADDFLILRDGSDDSRNGSKGGDMIGFCWLKIDATVDQKQLGEFYAVGIDPDRQGEGLGRVLMDAGFERLADRGIRTAVLYVEADNEPALALYRRYGFEQHTIDVRYRLAQS